MFMGQSRKQRVQRVIPGCFTPAEMDAAFRSQDAGVPHPKVTAAHWNTIAARWTSLPSVWGRGPWLDQSPLSVRIRTGLGISGRLYRVTKQLWGLELEGTPTGSGVHRGTLDAMLAHALAHWPTPTEAQLREGAENRASHERKVGGEVPAVEAAKLDVATRARSAKLQHRGTPNAAKWAGAPSRGTVVFPAFAKFGGPPPLVDWDGFDRGAPMSKEQRRAAESLVKHGPALTVSLGAALLADERAFCEDPSWTRSRSPAHLMPRIKLSQLHFTSASHAGSAYVWAAFKETWRAEHGLAAVLYEGRVVAIGGVADLVVPSGAPKALAPAHDKSGAVEAEAWAQDPYDAVVALPFWKGWPGAWRVSVIYEDDEFELTDPQHAAARALVDDGRAIKDALLARLRSSLAAKSGRPLSSMEALRRHVRADRIRILAEDRDGIAYTEVRVRAAWRRHESATLVMHGSRVVGLTVRANVEDVVGADMDAGIASRRARPKRSRR